MSFLGFLLKERGITLEKVSNDYLDANLKDSLASAMRLTRAEHDALSLTDKAIGKKLKALATISESVKHRALDAQAVVRADQVQATAAATLSTLGEFVVRDFQNTLADVQNVGKMYMAQRDYRKAAAAIQAEFARKRQRLQNSWRKLIQQYQLEMDATAQVITHLMNTIPGIRVTQAEIRKQIEILSRGGASSMLSAARSRSAQLQNFLSDIIDDWKRAKADQDRIQQEIDNLNDKYLAFQQKKAEAQKAKTEAEYRRIIEPALQTFWAELKADKVSPNVAKFLADMRRIPAALAAVSRQKIDSADPSKSEIDALDNAWLEHRATLVNQLRMLQQEQQQLKRAKIFADERADQNMASLSEAINALQKCA